MECRSCQAALRSPRHRGVHWVFPLRESNTDTRSICPALGSAVRACQRQAQQQLFCNRWSLRSTSLHTTQPDWQQLHYSSSNKSVIEYWDISHKFQRNPHFSMKDWPWTQGLDMDNFYWVPHAVFGFLFDDWFQVTLGNDRMFGVSWSNNSWNIPPAP